MRKIQILAILVIVALVFTGLKGGIEGAVDGWNQAGDSREFDFSTVNVAVKADETLIADSLLIVWQSGIFRIVLKPWRHKWKSPFGVLY